MSEEEFVELRVRVPKSVVDFVRDQLLKGEDEGKYWTDAVMESVGADVDHDGYLLKQDILERYGLSYDYFFEGGR